PTAPGGGGGRVQKSFPKKKGEFDSLNAHSFEYQSLKREAEADKTLYEELIRKIKEAGINAGFENSAIRIADPARAAVKPVFPNLPLNIALAFLFSTLLAIGAAVMRDVLENPIRAPARTPSVFKTEVRGSLPMVKSWRHHLSPARTNEVGTTALVRADGSQPGDRKQSITGFEEAVRTLRNSILLGNFDRRLKSLMITSATPAEGKTTTAVHLAVDHAQQKHKTWLIDCDMRRPGVHSKVLCFC